MKKFRCSNNGVGLHLLCGGTSVGGEVPGTGSSFAFSNPNDVTINVVWSETLPLDATIAGYPIIPHTKEWIDIPSTTLFVAAICPGGTDQPLSIHRGYETD